MDAIAEKENLVGLTGDDERFVKQTRESFRELRRSVYQKVCAICEIDKAAEVLCEDDKRTLRELREKWADWYVADLQPEQPKTPDERHTEVTEDIIEKLEGILSDYLPCCQNDVIAKLADRLPKRLADDEQEELRDTAGCEITNAVMASGLNVKGQIVVLKKMREAFLKARGNDAAKK